MEVWCCHVSMDHNLWERSPTPCWIFAFLLGHFWRQKGVQPIRYLQAITDTVATWLKRMHFASLSDNSTWFISLCGNIVKNLKISEMNKLPHWLKMKAHKSTGNIKQINDDRTRVAQAVFWQCEIQLQACVTAGVSFTLLTALFYDPVKGSWITGLLSLNSCRSILEKLLRAQSASYNSVPNWTVFPH